ncbi:MAG TPA: hypothetical protein VFF48_02295 [Brevundimonas sp.]|nr:hypothetical protein [Brevundimonas sp.]
MTIGCPARKTIAAALAAAAACLAPAALAGPSDTYYERAFVLAADARCGWFEPRLGSALSAATAQARGAALRSGIAASDLTATAARARTRAHGVSCSDPQLATVRARVDGAFSGWLRTPRMTFPGAKRNWTADRTRSDATDWKLSQQARVGASPVTFGYAGAGDASDLTTVVSFVGRSRPYAARIVLRDAAQVPRPWLTGDGLVPASARVSYWATSVAAADRALLTDGNRAGEAWRFPATAALALERLDPRESFAVEFHFRDGTAATARFEAGDFAAARAFMAMGVIGA